jgi:hypothetical protein
MRQLAGRLNTDLDGRLNTDLDGRQQSATIRDDQV